MLDHAHWAAAACSASTTTVGDGVVDKCKEGRWKLLGGQLCIRPPVGQKSAAGRRCATRPCHRLLITRQILVGCQFDGRARENDKMREASRLRAVGLDAVACPSLEGGCGWAARARRQRGSGRSCVMPCRQPFAPLQQAALRLTDMPASNQFVNSTF